MHFSICKLCLAYCSRSLASFHLHFAIFHLLILFQQGVSLGTGQKILQIGYNPRVLHVRQAGWLLYALISFSQNFVVLDNKDRPCKNELCYLCMRLVFLMSMCTVCSIWCEYKLRSPFWIENLHPALPVWRPHYGLQSHRSSVQHQRHRYRNSWRVSKPSRRSGQISTQRRRKSCSGVVLWLHMRYASRDLS